MVTCSPDGYVSALGLPSQNLSGTLSPGIGNLTNLQSVLMQNNSISGSIPASIGKLKKLQTLDLSSNKLHGEMPSSFGDLRNLNYLRLNNNSLTGKIPESLSGVGALTLVLEFWAYEPLVVKSGILYNTEPEMPIMSIRCLNLIF
ncbi:hypothetical protein POM88_039457 [Heracleum sosnowskyi]|uniref:Disease resistance R13L4/SHOC-2-like LRR domain-containing protein n=1 Tax=Heracleum sosnowskyi TaxID=360622 RepID=A0AAD8HC96_9APIA|nr:hypothetical protein POM88_039457 [Heracleum sosnowskyi]